MKMTFKWQFLLIFILLAPCRLNIPIINAENWTYSDIDGAQGDQGCINCHQNYSTETKSPHGSWQNQFEETKKPHTGATSDSGGSFFMLSALN